MKPLQLQLFCLARGEIHNKHRGLVYCIWVPCKLAKWQSHAHIGLKTTNWSKSKWKQIPNFCCRGPKGSKTIIKFHRWIAPLHPVALLKIPMNASPILKLIRFNPRHFLFYQNKPLTTFDGWLTRRGSPDNLVPNKHCNIWTCQTVLVVQHLFPIYGQDRSCDRNWSQEVWGFGMTNYILVQPVRGPPMPKKKIIQQQQIVYSLQLHGWETQTTWNFMKICDNITLHMAAQGMQASPQFLRWRHVYKLAGAILGSRSPSRMMGLTYASSFHCPRLNDQIYWGAIKLRLVASETRWTRHTIAGMVAGTRKW